MFSEGEHVRNFAIVRVLGQGGFGVTYLVQDPALQKQFAMKEYFPRDFAVRSGATIQAKEGEVENFLWGKERFLDEARMLARFNHPNIVGVSQIFEENNTAYIILDYQSGRSLSEWLKEVSHNPSQLELDQIARPILGALGLIHKNNLLHRDVAPDNIYIRDDGTPVLLDFGSAREAIAARTKTISAVVKGGYSPPEQYSTRGSGQGPWTDIYSFAATLYISLVGAPPPESTERLLEETYTPLNEVLKDRADRYRSNFLAAIDWGLRLAPKDRPQSVERWSEMLFDVETSPVPRPEVENPTEARSSSNVPSVNLPADQPAPRVQGNRTILPLAFGVASVLTISGFGYIQVSNWEKTNEHLPNASPQSGANAVTY